MTMNQKGYRWIAILIFLIAGLWIGMQMTNYSKVDLYFPDSNGEWLIAEERRVEKVPDEIRADQLMEELIKGPSEEGLTGSVPGGTALLPLTVESPKIVIEDKIAHVNFSVELINNHPGGSTGEAMTLGSIVNTLTELNEIDQVQIYVNGEKVETLSGHFSVSEPLDRIEELIKP